MTTKTTPHLLLGMAVLGAASLGLSAGGVNAADTKIVCTFSPTSPCATPTTPTQVGDKILTLLEGPTVGSGSVTFEWVDYGTPNLLDDLYSVDVSLSPALAGPASGMVKYNLAIDPLTPPGGYAIFRTVGLAWDALATPGVTLTKKVYSDPYTTLVAELNTQGQVADLVPFNLKEIWVQTTFNVPGGSSVPLPALKSFTNNYTQVPAPLPLLGAGTAFGFSRRLRRRLKGQVSLG